MAGKDKSVYIWTAWETHLNKWVFQPDSILIPVEFQRNSYGFQRNSYGFHWNSTGMTGFLQHSTGIPVDSCGFHRNSTGMTGFLQDSCRNRWGTVKYCHSMLALSLLNFILIIKKTPFNWLQLSTSWVLLRVQLAGQCRDDSLCYYLVVHSLNTKNPYLHVTYVFTMAYI